MNQDTFDIVIPAEFKRICSTPNCGTILSRYNASDKCGACRMQRPEPRPGECECGCGLLATGNGRYRKGHQPKEVVNG